MAELNFYQTVNAAIADMVQYGFTSLDRVATWVQRIRGAAERSLIPEAQLERALIGTFKQSYKSLIENGGILKYHKGVPKFTIDRVKPRCRAELDRSIVAAKNLIKMNREAAVDTTTKRFAGWATSIPIGGTRATDKVDTSIKIRKALSSLPFEERRVATDQGAKFLGNLNKIVATDGGAIAMIWHSHWRQKGYDYREDHKERDGVVYMIRGNWALEKGLIKLAGRAYYDTITAVGEEVYCRCDAQYIYSINMLPPDMLTEKGKSELQRVRNALNS